MIRPTATGWTVLAGGAVLVALGLLLGYPTLTGLGLAAGVAFAAGVGSTLIRPRVTVRRQLVPDRVTVGEPAVVRLVVRNRSSLPAPGFTAVERVGGEPLPMAVPPIGGRQRMEATGVLPTQRRGMLRVGPVAVERTDLLGLVRTTESLSDQDWLWVRPRVHRLPTIPLGVVLDFEGRQASRAPRGSTAFASLREYTPGDEPRHIHWRTSARLGILVVREHVDTTEPTTAIVLDTREEVFDADRFEQAVEIAASIAAASVRASRPITLAALGEDVDAVRRAGGYEVLDRLAAIHCGPHPATALLRLVEQTRPGGSLVVVTGDAAGLIPILAAQRRRFAQVIVIAFATGPGATGAVTRRAGLAVLRARTAREAARAWTRLVVGGAA